MTRPAHDTYLIFLPDSPTLPRLAWRYDAVVRAMHELGPKARVLRVTEDEYCRDMTDEFKFRIEPETYEDDEVSARRHRREQARKYTFGTRSL